MLRELAPTTHHQDQEHDDEQCDDEEPYDEAEDEVRMEETGATLGAVEVTHSRCHGWNEKHESGKTCKIPFIVHLNIVRAFFPLGFIIVSGKNNNRNS